MTTDTTRREFLQRIAAVGVTLPCAFEILAQESLPTRAIPSTGERLPIVGLGSSKAVLEIPTEGTDPLQAVLRLLVQKGGRVVDTSPRTEAIDTRFGSLLSLPDLREKLFIAAKINTNGRQAGIEQMRQMQRLWRRETLDLIQVESMRDLETHWPNLREWKNSRQARYIGVTVSSDALHDRLEGFMRAESFDFVHVNYSIVETHAEQRLLPLARDRGMAVLINRPFMNGTFFQRVANRKLPEWAADFDCATWAQFSLKYILGHPAVTCVLTETTNPVHMQENIQAGFGRLPDDATRRRMRELALTF
ncbi:MAG: aldo/keto reductase [Gemmatimonadota bacterium]